MRLRLPAPDTTVPPAVKAYLDQLLKALHGTLTSVVSTNTPVGSILLVSPNGSVYSVKVTDAGALVTEIVYDTTP